MLRDQYNVVVIGGGPAGTAAAYTLASAGRRVCLIDRAVFPREKLCGGLITLRSKKTFESVFGGSWDENILTSSKDVSFFSNGKFLARVNGYSQLFFTMRVDFDNYLLGLAKQAGAILKLGQAVTQIDLARKVVSLQSGEQMSFEFLIGADGVNSQVAKTLFGTPFNPNTIGFGLEVEVPRQRLPQQTDKVEIDFGSARWGYGWVFPKRHTFTIGVGGIHKLNPDLRNRLSQYLHHKGLDASEFRVKGQYIPFGDFREQPGVGNVLLCGDAAGVVDPITGEGIAYAMQSGAAAARAIVKARSCVEVGGALDGYMSDYSSIAASIRQANFWRQLIFPKAVQRPFAWAFSDAGTLQKGYLDILAGERDYNSLYKLFAIQVGKGLKKLAATTWSRLFGEGPRMIR